MSAMLSRTWNYVSASVAQSLGQGGPSWTYPDPSACPGRDGHLPPALAQFLRSLRDCPTPQAEAQLVRQQLHQLEAKLRRHAEPPASLLTDALVRAMAVRMLGHPGGQFMHIHAVQLAQKGNLLQKKMGYLACSVLLDETDPLVVLLINTIKKDLASSNLLEVNIALTAAVHVANKELGPMVLPEILRRATHSQDFIRKKSLACLHHLLVQSPALSRDLEPLALQGLQDVDPGVVAVSVQLVHTLCQLRPKCDHRLLPALCHIQDQVLSGRLPDDYNYRGTPAPWLQIYVLRLIELVLHKSPWDCAAYDSVTELLNRTLAEAADRKQLGPAIVYECVMVIATMNKLESDVVRTQLALGYVDKFLKSKHPNLRYMGLSALETLVRHSPPAGLNLVQEESVSGCLEHLDETIRRKALELLCLMAGTANVKATCDVLIGRLRATNDDHYRNTLAGKTLDLAEKHSPGLDWYVSVQLKVLQQASADLKERVLDNLKRCLGKASAGNGSDDKQAEDVVNSLERNQVGWKLVKLVRNIMVKQDQPAPTMLRLYVWCLAHFYHMEEDTDVSEEVRPIEALKRIVQVGRDRISHLQDEDGAKWHFVLVSCLGAIRDLMPNLRNEDYGVVSNFLERCDNGDGSATGEIALLASELNWLLPHADEVSECVGSATPDDDDDDDLCFLDNFVVRALRAGKCQPYRPELKVKAAKSATPEREMPDLSPYHQQPINDSMLVSTMSTVSQAYSLEQDGASKPRYVWTMEGRVEVAGPEDHGQNVEKAGSLIDKLTVDDAPLSPPKDALEDVADELRDWSG